MQLAIATRAFLAALTAAVVLVAATGCRDVERLVPAAAPAGPASATPVATASAAASGPPATGVPTTAPVATGKAKPNVVSTRSTGGAANPTGGSGGGGPNKPPRVVSITPSVTDVTPPPCGPTTRVTITARVTDPDDSPTSLKVRLDYSFEAQPNYTNQVTLSYSANAKAFAYTLPAFTENIAKGEAGHISVTVTVQDPSGAGPRPTSMNPINVSSCVVLENG